MVSSLAQGDGSRPRRIFVGHRGQILGQFSNILGSPNNFTRYEGRFVFRTPPVPVADIQFVFANWFYSDGEQNGSNALIANCVIEVDNVALRMPISLSSSVVAAVGGTYYTDVVPIHLAANSDIYCRFEVIVTAGHTAPSGYQISNFGDAAYASNAASQTLGVGRLYLPSGGVALDTGYGPIAMLGVPQIPIPSLVLVGDSIFQGLNDAIAGDGHGNYGWVERGLWSAWRGGTLGQYRAKRAGDTLALNLRTNSLKKRQMFQYGTHALFGLGNNDIAGSSLANIQTRLQELWFAAKYRGMRVYQALYSPRTTSTDSWLTTENQTCLRGYEPGNVRDQANAWIKMQIGRGSLDGYLDPNLVWEDPSSPGKWKTDGATPNLYTVTARTAWPPVTHWRERKLLLHGRQHLQSRLM